MKKTLATKTKVAVVTTIVLWASAFVGIRQALQSYSPGSLALFRFLIASVCMFFFYFLLPKRHCPNRKDIPNILIVGFCGIGIYNIALNNGEITVTAGISSFILGLMPIIALILSILFLNEKVTKKIVIGISLSFLGMLLIAFGETQNFKFDYHLLYVFLAALIGAIFTVSQKPLLKKFHPIEIASFGIWLGTLSLFFYFPTLIEELPKSSWESTSTVIYLGIFPAAIAYATWSIALHKAPASSVVTYLYGMPIIATTLGWMLLGEKPHLLASLGGLIALFGAYFANKKNKTMPK